MIKNFIIKTGTLGLASLFLFFNSASSQTVNGLVIDKADHKTLQGVAVKIANGKKGVITDSSGRFVIKNWTNTSMHLSISYTGYDKLDTVLQIKNNENVQVQFELVAEEKNLEEVVIVSSSRTNSRIEDLPTKVEVLGAEEVHEENGIKPGNIASMLGDIAGIQIQQTSASTGNADMRIQGLQGKYTQILRDGMPLFGGYAGSFSILQIPPLDLQQIELVKGASSTLYGGGAIAGMVNLISKKPKLNKFEKSITINTSTLKETNFNSFFSARNEKLGYTLYAGTTQQKQVDVDKDGFSDVPAVKSVFIHPRIFIYGKGKSSLVLGYTMNYEDRNGGDMAVLQNGVAGAHQFYIQNKSLRNTADFVWEGETKNGGLLTAKGNTSIFNRDINTNVYGMKGKQDSWYTELAYAKKFEHHNLVMGINFNGEQFKKQGLDSSLFPNDAFNTTGAFAQDDWKWTPQFTMQSGLRIDNNSKYGAFVLPRISFMYKLNSRVTMRLGGGDGYKTPTLFNSEMDERDYKHLVGLSSAIKSEKSLGMNFDINYKVRTNGWDITLNQTVFYNSIQHPIVLSTALGDPLMNQINNAGNSISQLTYYNETKSLESKGLETYFQAIKAPFEFYAGYVYTDAKRNYNSINPNLPLIAKHKLASVIAYEFDEDFRIGLESSYTGKQHLDNGTSTTPYLFSALMLRYNIGKAAFVLNCENLFDERQNKNKSIVGLPLNNPSFPEIWAPLDGRVINLSMYLKW
jgi:outer membrane receptor for ferrienterochelin and colicins